MPTPMSPSRGSTLATFAGFGLIGGMLMAGGIFYSDQLPRALASSAAPAAAPPPPQVEVAALPPAGEAQEGIRALKQFSSAFSAVADQVRPSVVSIQVERKADDNVFSAFGSEGLPFGNPFEAPRRSPHGTPPTIRAGGSGVIVSPDGQILTNNHVIDGAERIVVHTMDGQEYEARVRGTDPKTDLAVIKIDASGLTPARFADSDQAHVGEWVIAIGHPYSLEYTVTAGIVSATGRSNFHKVQYEDFIQTDASINPGNSGGPLVNLQGEVLGINTMIDGRGPGLGFSIPSNMARRVMDQLIANGRVVRPWLGVRVQDVDKAMSQALGFKSGSGAFISAVEPGSPAARAGLKAEDIILALDGKAIKDSTDLVKTVISKDVSQEVELEVLREGEQLRMKLTTAELPGDTSQTLADPDAEEEPQSQWGMELRPLTPQLSMQLGVDQSQGVVVWRVDPDGRAAEAGLRRLDVIVEARGKGIKDQADLGKVLADPGLDAVLLKIVRGGETAYVALARR